MGKICCAPTGSRELLLAQADAPVIAVDASQSVGQRGGKQPNIVFIMGDDIGWLNIGAYHQGLMAGRTPNLYRLAPEGTRFSNYYAEASCTAGRANFIEMFLPQWHKVMVA